MLRQLRKKEAGLVCTCLFLSKKKNKEDLGDNEYGKFNLFMILLENQFSYI